MPTPYKHKRSTEAGVAPTTLQDGEIAINVAAADPKLFYKDSASTIRAFSLASYASVTHTHVVADVTDFTTKANVVSVNGITGVVSISHTSVSAAAASHTHAASDVVSGTFDIARIPTVSYTALSNVPTSFTPSAHTHVAADVVNLTSVANVVSVNGITGSVILTNASVSAASAVHSHVAADITNFTSVANVVSVNAKTGVVSISHTDVTAASASHTHAASDVTSGTLDAARLPLATTLAVGGVIVGTGLGVSSGTVSVTYGTTSGTACQGNDSRLSDARTPTSHSHGNISNAGAIGSTSGLPVITTTSGVLTTGTFSTSAGTFCEGNDARLSDTRTPTDGSVTTAKLANDAVTYAKIQNVSATDRLLGRSSEGSGDVEEISCGSFGRSLISSADAAAARTTLSVQPTASPAFTGSPSIINSGASANSTIRYGNSGQNWYVGLRGDTSNVFAVSDDVTFRFQINTSGVITCGGQLLVTAGSGSDGSYRPGVAVSGDDDTGLQQVGGADTISLVTAGNERLRVTDSRVFINGNGEQYGLGVRYVRTGGAVHFGATSNSESPDAAISNAGGGTLLLAKNNGEVIVGGTTDQGAYNLQCNGTGVWGAGAYVNGSDKRIKDEIAPIGEATNVITAMQPVTFRYKPTWSSDRSIQPGFVAQQLQEALAGTPYLGGVVQKGTEYLSVAYQSLIPLLVKALQESNARIAALEEKINA